MGWIVRVSMRFIQSTTAMGKMTARCEVLLDEKLMYPRDGKTDEETMVVTRESVDKYQGLDMHGWKKKVFCNPYSPDGIKNKLSKSWFDPVKIGII